MLYYVTWWGSAEWLESVHFIYAQRLLPLTHIFYENEFYLSQLTTKPIKLLWSAKTQISLCFHAVWSVLADRMCVLQSPGYPKRDKGEPLPYWVDVQAYLCLCWSHRSYCRFCHALAHFCGLYWNSGKSLHKLN